MLIGRRRMMLAFLVGIGVSPKVLGMAENLGRTHVSQENFCHPSGAPCLYTRFETTGAEVLAFLFTRRDAARRGLLGGSRVECAVTGPVGAVWNAERIATVRGVSGCTVSGAGIQVAPSGDGILISLPR